MTEPFPDQSADVDADHLAETPESLRDFDPESMPIDRGRDLADRPLGAEKLGTTHAEEAQGEPLDLRLNEEEPDVGAHDPVDDIVADHPETFAASGVDAEQTDEELLADAYAGAGAAGDGTDAAVGRLVEPDEGAHTDEEKDAVATALGRDGGDLSAEESAMHLEEQP